MRSIFKDDEQNEQIQSDEILARQLESDLSWANVKNKDDISHNDVLQSDPPFSEVVVIDESGSTLTDDNDVQQQVTKNINFLEELSKRVDTTDQFFLVARRGANLLRCLNLWQRVSKRTSANKTLRVHFTGEDGIDSGAMANEFLTKVITDMRNTIFRSGTPVDSTNNVQNGHFSTCGEIAAVSLSQGGPPPCFFHECAYEQMVNPKKDLKHLDDNDITPGEKVNLDNIISDLINNRSTIIDHGYTGKIDQEHISDIRRSVIVSLVTKRQLYLSEFMKGLEMYGLAEMVKQHPEEFKQYFVIGQTQPVDANFVFSLMKPRYSEEGSTRKEIEENMMDMFQDFLNLLEDSDEMVTGYSEAVSWNYLETDECPQPCYGGEDEKFQLPEISVPGLLGWLTGQQHRPINGDPLNIFVHFDHDCLVRKPDHTICFPCVGACGRELTLPVSHMKDEENFKRIFITALSKGQSFTRP